MLPSPSLGPPWLSLSLSPAFGPCGIPEDAELPPLELVDDAAGAEEELDDFEDEEPPPQPATAMAATTSAIPNQRRADNKVMFIRVPLITHKERRRAWFLPAGRIRSVGVRPSPTRG
jgi:hypothetical protein